jgi:hypothetical protein
METTTSAIRNSGSPVTETQTLAGQSATRSYTVGLTAWANNGAVTSCTNWSPDPSTVTVNQSYTQTATDCLQPQTRTRSESYVDHLSGATVPVSSVTQSQSITASSTRTATGTLETWAATTSVYSAWANTVGKVQYSCSNWSPAGSTKTAAGAFTQTATDCKTDQTRTRQDREMEVDHKGDPQHGVLVTEIQTLTGQSATRSYTVALTAWANNGAVTSCSNWSPDPSTVTINKAFTQTATDCLQPQTRTRSESYVDHLSGSTVAVSSVTQTQSITASSTRAATGTLETWAATTSVYSAWANTVGKVQYSCTNWSPAGSTKTVAGAFTQTATDCKTDQTRTRQDREMESTTKAIRNSGSAVTESQTLSGQSATRSYTVSLSAWANNGVATGCTNWSPDVSTYSQGVAFNQQATDCQQAQTRTRAESYVDHLSGNTVAVSSVTQSQTLTNQTGTRTATGTAINPTVAFSAPASAFANNPLSLTWSGTNVVSYTLQGNATGSGYSVTPVDVGTSNSVTVTPTAAGTFSYTLGALNTAGKSTSASKSIVIEAAPTLTSVVANGSAAISVSPSVALSFTATGISSGATLQARNSANSAAASFPTQASSTAGTSTYYGAAYKTLNGVTLYSAVKPVTVTVVSNPVITAFTASATPYVGQAFSLSWTGTDVSSYVLSSNAAGSGIATAGVAMGTTVTRSITPTVAGTYTYTLTATNSLGVTTTTNKTLVVDDPSVHGTVTVIPASGANSPLKMVVGTTYSGTASQIQKGIATKFLILIGNYNNASNGTASVNVCSSTACASGTANLATSVDNVGLSFTLSSPLTFAKGDTLSYSISIANSTYTPAIWIYDYGGGSPGNGSKLSGTSGYPNIMMTYQ